ncbi:hypothetical protein ACLB2K_006096 [Fragaria x ananassa]
MATLRSRPWSDYNTGHGHEARSSSCPCKPSYKLNVMKNQRFGTAWLAQRSRKRYLVAQGYGSESREAYVISNQDKKFVNALREVQPYIFLNRGRTFVVVVAGEIVASPYFDAILQVNIPILITQFDLHLLIKTSSFSLGNKFMSLIMMSVPMKRWLVNWYGRKRIPTQ